MADGQNIRAVLDANVIYPPFLRDILLRLAVANLYHPHWSERIHDEWMRNVSADRPDMPHISLARIRSMMDAQFPHALVAGDTSLEALFGEVAPEDRHVAAVALKAGAQWIVTANLKDFPADALRPHGIQAVHPDRFLVDLTHAHPLRVRNVLHAHRTGLLRPPMHPEQYKAAFIRAGLPRSAALLWP